MRIRRSLLLGLFFALAYGPAQASADQGVCIYVEDRDLFRGSATGHAFTELLPQSPPPGPKPIFGFHPAIEWRFLTGSPGQIQQEPDHGWTWKICYRVSRDQYEDADQLIKSDTANPPKYVFLSFNCTDWAYKVANRVRVDLPPGTILGGISDPAKLAAALRKRYESGDPTYKGGTIHPNRNSPLLRVFRASPATSGNPAPEELEGTESLYEINDLAFYDPSAAAESLDMSPHQRKLPKVEVGADGTLRLALAGIDPGESLTEIRFGDGNRDVQGARFSHSFDDPGTYRVRGIAIADAAVFKFRFRAVVDRGEEDVSVRASVPDGQPDPDGLPPSRPSPLPLG